MRNLLLISIIAFAAPFAVADAAPVRPSLRVRLDEGPAYLILASRQASEDYAKAISIARDLHPAAFSATFPAADLNAAKAILQARQPQYVLLFLKPDELDVNFAWQWLTLCSELDGGPLLSTSTGIITGASADDAAAFMQRISDAVRNKQTLADRFVDDLGPNSGAGKTDFQRVAGNFIIPVLGQAMDSATISHGTEAFTDRHLDSMNDAGLLHFGGHGNPDRVDDGIRGTQVARMKLSPCIAFNGACYTGVTHRWFDQFNASGKIKEETVAAGDCFCLNMLRTGTLAYFAALHPDHGMPVYQEMEYLAYSGDSLGHVMRHTHNGVILADGGHLPRFEHLAAGMPMPAWSDSETMLKGTASRVLFGDPAMVVTDAMTPPPFRVEVEADGRAARITATLNNLQLKSTFTDTYYSDLSADRSSFNGRALIVAELPATWDSVADAAVVRVVADGKNLESRLRGYALDRANHRFYAQVDVPGTGFLQSPFCVAGATVELRIRR